MAGVPETFTKLSPVLANYDFVDVVSGTGYITFYAGNTVDKRVLSNFAFYSDVVGDTQSVSLVRVDLELYDHDYDVTLNRPLDVKGLGIVTIPTLSGDWSSNTYSIVSFSKWDGVTETVIVTNTSTSNTTAGTYRMSAIDLDIPLTHFKKGETIRLTIKYYINKAAGTGTYGYGHDPKSRTAGWDTTGAVPSQLTFLCPVRLNI